MPIRALLPGSGYLDPDTLAVLTEAYDDVWRECEVDFGDPQKLNAAQSYVARAILAAHEDEIVLDGIRAAGRAAMLRLKLLS